MGVVLLVEVDAVLAVLSTIWTGASTIGNDEAEPADRLGVDV